MTCQRYAPAFTVSSHSVATLATRLLIMELQNYAAVRLPAGRQA